MGKGSFRAKASESKYKFSQCTSVVLKKVLEEPLNCPGHNNSAEF